MRRAAHAVLAAHVMLASLVVTPPAAADLRLSPSADPGARLIVVLDPPSGSGAQLVIRPVTGLAGAEQLGPAIAIQPVAAGLGLVELTAPSAPGSYRVRLEEAGRLRDSAALEVVAAPAAFRIHVVERARPGEPVTVSWEFAGSPGDRLLVETPEGRAVSERPLGAAEAAARAVEITAPEASGRYLIRYVSARGRQVVSVGFAVDGSDGLIGVPATVTAGRPFEADRIGPGGGAYEIVVLDASGALEGRVGLEGTGGFRGAHWLTAPARPGRYRVIYRNRETGEVVSEIPLIVTR